MPSRGCAPRTGLPSMRTSPDVGLRRPVARLSKVDLPQPLGPITATISSSRQVKESSRSTSTTAPRRPEKEKPILRNSSIVPLSRVGGAEHGLADAERLGVDQHEGDARPRGAAVGPGVIGAALYHDVAGLQLDGRVVHVHL